MSAIDLVIARVTDPQSASFEGMRADAYDDATGLPVEALCQGVPTIGYGCACRQWSKDLALTVLRFQLGALEAQLLAYPWYRAGNDARRSALLEIAFNQGVTGLLRYPHMLADAQAGNWAGASIQCTVNDPRLRARYNVLAKILMTGEAV